MKQGNCRSAAVDVVGDVGPATYRHTTSDDVASALVVVVVVIRV